MPKGMTKFTRLENMLYENFSTIESFESQLNNISEDFFKYTEGMLNLFHAKKGRKRNIQRISEETEEFESTNQSSETDSNQKSLRSEKNLSIISNIIKNEKEKCLKRKASKTVEEIISKQMNVKEFNTLEIEIKKEKRSVQQNQNNEDKENEFPMNVRITRQSKNSKTFNLNNNSLLNVLVKQEAEHVHKTSKDTTVRNSTKKNVTSDNKFIKKLSNSSHCEDDVIIQNSEPIIIIINDSFKETVDNHSKNNIESIENNSLVIEKNRNGIKENLLTRHSTKELHNKLTASGATATATQILNNVFMQVNKNVEGINASKCRTPSIKQSNGKPSNLKKNQQLLFNPLDSVKKKVEALEKLNSAELNSTPLKTTRVTRIKTRALQLNDKCKENNNEKVNKQDPIPSSKSNVNNIISRLEEKQTTDNNKITKKDIKQKNGIQVITKVDENIAKNEPLKQLRTRPVRLINKDTKESEILKKTTRQVKKNDLKNETTRKRVIKNENNIETKKMKIKESKTTTRIKKENIIKSITVLDVNTDDETEDEESTKRVVPMWSKTVYREIELKKQFHVPKNIIDNFFGSRPTCINLKELFPEISGNRLKRRSSAIWSTPPRYSLMPKV